jgi:hypothetical protein
MTNELKRILLFLFGCIGARLALVYVAKTISLQYLPVLGYAALLVAIGFMYFFITGTRQTGAEVFGDKIWWNNLRPVHAALYGLFAYNAINKNKDAWMFLLADVLIGIVAFVRHHAF